jgi:hypothetical protein
MQQQTKRTTTTTIKISRKVMRHIDAAASVDESVDETLRRLLGLSDGTEKPGGVPPPNTTIKVSKVMNHIQQKAKPKESRDETLSRLLGIAQDDGNVRAKS